MKMTIEEALQRGIALDREGSLTEAKRFYRAVLDSEPTNADANFKLGTMLVSLGKAADALPLLRNALQANPNNEEFLKSLVGTLIQEGQLEEATSFSVAAKQSGCSEETLKHVNSCIELATDASVPPPQGQLDALLNCYRSGRFEEAEQLASPITKDYPRHPFAFKVLGALLWQLGRTPDALAASERAVALSPDDAEAHNNFGSLLREVGELGAAQEAFIRATSLNPNYVEAYLNLGTLLQDKDRLVAAEKAYHQALSLQPKNVRTHKRLGDLYKHWKRFSDAESSYRTAIELSPENADFHNDYGLVLKDEGKYEAAADSLQRAISLRPNFAGFHYNLGNCLRSASRVGEAVKCYYQAIEIDPGFLNARDNLCGALRELGDQKELIENRTLRFEHASRNLVTSADLSIVIPHFVEKIELQKGVPTFFDNGVEHQLRYSPREGPDYCRIFQDSLRSQEKRFISFRERKRSIAQSAVDDRLFDGLPFMVSTGVHAPIQWKGHNLYKSAFDLVLYSMLIPEVRPDLIIELGSGDGGSATWLADISRMHGLKTKIFSFDIVRPSFEFPNVTFFQSDLNMVEQQIDITALEQFPGRKILIEDAHVNLEAVLRTFDAVLDKDDYLIVEDSDMKQEIIERFTSEIGEKYQVDQYFLDFFGTNITCSTNSIFKVF